MAAQEKLGTDEEAVDRSSALVCASLPISGAKAALHPVAGETRSRANGWLTSSRPH